MKAAPLLIAWHNESNPIYSVQFEPNGNRLATAGGDTNVRLWKLNGSGEDREVIYLSTLTRHSAAVNVVRWSPRGEMLASAGDDGNVLLWVPADHHAAAAMGDDTTDDKETWIVKRMCRSNSGAEIYDLAWSPDGTFFVTGGVDNVVRIFSAENGAIVRQIAKHHHFVQGVAWDPLNEFIATQSSDRSVHIYGLKTNDGQLSLSEHGRMSKMDLPARRRTSNSPAPPDFGHNRGRSTSNTSNRAPSPAPSAPDTPRSLAPMNPPPTVSRSRRSSIGNGSPSVRRSASPAPSAGLPLPAVMAASSPDPYLNLGIKNTNIYHNETLTTFFRRLAFAPDGSLLFTPAGQYITYKPPEEGPDRPKNIKGKQVITNTVYIYSRAGLDKPPIAVLPGHTKPSVAVKCSPVFYNHRLPTATKNVTIDNSNKDDDITPLPEPAHPAAKPATSAPSPEPPQITPVVKSAADPKSPDSALGGPKPAFDLPYRIVYAVATQDTVYVYDTQQATPLCVVSNLHYASLTDLSWSNDGKTLLISSNDGFASILTFAPGELGTTYRGSLQARVIQPTSLNTAASNSLAPSPVPTPTGAQRSPGLPPPGPPKQSSIATAFAASPSPAAGRPSSPARSNSASSIATQSSYPQTPASYHGLANPIPTYTKLPSVAAAGSGTSTLGLPSPTPPMTPFDGQEKITGPDGFAVPPARTADSDSVLGKRGSVSESEKEGEPKKRRIAPTLVGGQGS